MKKLVFCLVLCVAFAALPWQIMAEEPQILIAQGMAVYVRVESSAEGAEETLLPRTPVFYMNDEIAEKTPTVLDALLNAAQGEVETETGEYGAFIMSIKDFGDDTGRYAWMFTVNNETPWVSADACELAVGDEIVFYFIDWQETSYAFFDALYGEAEASADVTLTLNSLDFDGNINPVEGAQLQITSDAPMTRILHYTDENGKVTLNFAHPGAYHITARKGDGVSAISRPYAEVVVLAKPSIDNAGADNAVLPAPLPLMAFAPVSYDIETFDLYIAGQFIPLPDDLKPVFDEDLDELFIPLRALAEETGMRVAWAADTATVTILFSNQTYAFTTSDTFSGMPVKIIDNRVYVPTMFIIEVLMADF